MHVVVKKGFSGVSSNSGGKLLNYNKQYWKNDCMKKIKIPRIDDNFASNSNV